jgi:Protein of unknown function (DUF3419)
MQTSRIWPRLDVQVHEANSGLAIRIFQFVIRIRRLSSVVERMCNAETIEEQKLVWFEELRVCLSNSASFPQQMAD